MQTAVAGTAPAVKVTPPLENDDLPQHTSGVVPDRGRHVGLDSLRIPCVTSLRFVLYAAGMNWRSALQESRMQARSALHISGNQWASHLTKQGRGAGFKIATQGRQYVATAQNPRLFQNKN